MDWLGNNWIWLAFGAGVLALFASGRGGCGMGHGGHRRHDEAAERDRPREMTQRSLSTSPVTVGSADAPLQPASDVHGASSDREAGLATEHAVHRQHRHGC